MIGIVLDQRDARIRSREDLARKLRRNVQDAVDFAVAQIAQGRGLVAVGNRVKCCGVGGDGLAHFLQFDRRHAVVFVHDAHLKILDFSAERVAEHDELHQAA